MKTVVLGLSGGVDSSVAAVLLKEAGYNVIGAFMHNWEEEIGGVCTATADMEDARAVAERLGIPFHTVNFAKEYSEQVFSYFKEELKKGRTPNPDVLCNREVKFGVFFDWAMREFDADYIATGHYAKTENGKLLKPADKNKDQTYFLCQVRAEQLEKTLFPLADIEKPKVREIAKKYDLKTKNKKDSTGICFIGERNFRKFLSEHIVSRAGNIILDGKVIGKHDGLINYTIGQSKGLNIGGQKGYGDAKFVVLSKNLEKNELEICKDTDGRLFSKGVVMKEFSWVSGSPEVRPLQCKIRYRQESQDCTLDGNTVIFKIPQKAVAVGQFLVLYDGDICLGGGAIDGVL